ncbi:MAG: hypothetical protein AB7G21_11430 [Dehalococcoidia bacterium]
MVSFFDGGPPSVQDARALAERLVRGERLEDAQERRADIDRDGTPTSADVLLLLRAARGALTLPTPMPRLNGLIPVVARPGEDIEVTGTDLGTDVTEVRLVLTSDTGVVTVIAPQSLVNGSATFTLPATMDPRGRPYRALVLRSGVMSNPMTIWIGTSVVESVEAVAGTPNRAIIRGRGFAAPMRVAIGQLLLTPLTLSAESAEIDVTEITEPSLVVCSSGGVSMNPMAYTPQRIVSGTVQAPAALGLTPSSLAVWCGAVSAPVASSGAFTIAAPKIPLVEIEVAAAAGTVLAAVATPVGGALTIDVASTAVRAVVSVVAPPLDRAEALATWVAALPALPEVVALTDLLTAGLAAHGSVFAAIRADEALVRALALATNVARTHLASTLSGAS